MKLEDYSYIYFIGIGGIGMSALARYFNANNFNVSGYDKTETKLTSKLQEEGIEIHFTDLGSNVPEFIQKENTLIIYTPAIPKEFGELNFFRNNNFTIIKRAKALGLITETSKGLGVAGTHGKTTTSTLLAHVLNESHLGCNAFLGGIASNFESNLVLNKESEFTVIEADEFDQSFLQLSPYASIITSTDADHLDIYQDAQNLVKSFQEYADKTNDEGILIKEIDAEVSSKEDCITYAVNKENLKPDYNSFNLRYENNNFLFDCTFEDQEWKNIALGIPGIHNTANATSVIALCLFLGLSEEEIRHGLSTFKGVKRRFEYHLKTEKITYIDDYAHHPTEINALIDSVELLYPKKKKIGIFQPHLYSRTKDFLTDFAASLSKLDEVILLPIYAARELPIDGISSEAILEIITSTNKCVLEPLKALEHIKKNKQNAVYLSIGAGDIDKIVEPLTKILS